MQERYKETRWEERKDAELATDLHWGAMEFLPMLEMMRRSKEATNRLHDSTVTLTKVLIALTGILVVLTLGILALTGVLVFD